MTTTRDTPTRPDTARAYTERMVEKTVLLADISPHPQNPRQHPESQILQLKASHEQLGQFEPVILWQRPKGYIQVKGHGYDEGVKRTQDEAVKAWILPEDTPPAFVTQIMLASNLHALNSFDDTGLLSKLLQEQQELGIDLAALGTSEENLQALLDELESEHEDAYIEGEGAGGDEFDTTPQEDGPTRTHVGELWQLGKHRLLVGDSTKREDVERLMQGEKVDCVFTSPPYAVGVDYGEYKDTIENLRLMLPKLASIWHVAVVDGGFAVINYGDIASGRNVAVTEEPCEYPMSLEYWPVFRSAGWLLWSRRVWVKPNARVNSMWCIQSNRAASDWEHIWTWRKSGTPIIQRVDGEFSSCNGWFDSTNSEALEIGKDTHGAGMPLIVALRMLAVHSRDNSSVYEPFGGTGTTLIAGHRLGRKVFISELSPRYADVILRRYEAETGQTARLLKRSEETAHAL